MQTPSFICWNWPCSKQTTFTALFILSFFVTSRRLSLSGKKSKWTKWNEKKPRTSRSRLMSRQGLLGLFCVKLYAICIACTDIVSSISSLFHPLHFLHKIKARQASLAFWKKCVSNFMYPNCNRYFQLISSVTSYFAQILTTTQLFIF